MCPILIMCVCVCVCVCVCNLYINVGLWHLCSAICRTMRRRHQQTPSKAIGLRCARALAEGSALLLYCFTALLALRLGARPVSDGEAPALLLLLCFSAPALLLCCFTTRCKPGFRWRGSARARSTPSLHPSPRRLPCSLACLW